MTLNCFFILLLFFLIMSKSVMIALLEQGNTGTEILSILDSFIQDQESNNQPTSEPIDF